MTNKVLLVGNGGREHAWAIALQQSKASIINWAPIINPGIKALSIEIIEHDVVKSTSIAEIIKNKVKLAIIGPETPLVNGITDWLEELGIEVFSPSAKNARIEGSKSYMRELLERNNIKGNIMFNVCKSMSEVDKVLSKNIEVAIKPDGLTGGKGVKVHGDHFNTKEEILSYCEELIQKDGCVVLEEKLSGIEFSLQAFVYRNKIIFHPLVKDYKRAYDNDKGPNTGSMGSCSFPDHKLPYLSEKDIESAKKSVQAVVEALNEENGDYKGAIYGQFMLTKVGVKIIEFNARLGDPEAINTLALLKTPLLDVINQLKNPNTTDVQVEFDRKATCVVYLVPDGYPENPSDGIIIQLPENIQPFIRFASVEQVASGYQLSKSRSLALIGVGDNVSLARKNVYNKIPQSVAGVRYRTDIATDVINF
jgi:phosphoribosylamine---glycine ligase